MKKLLLLSALLIFTCSNESVGNPCIYEPTLETNEVTDITETSATLNGVISITSENCDVPNNTEQGFVYSTEIQPTLEDNQVNVNGTNISTTIEGLTPNTIYYVRVFLTNNFGDFYGNEVSFTTSELDEVPPIITLNGESTISLFVGDSYIEQGATATDDVDGDLTGSIVIGGDEVNTSVAGTYLVTYNVSDVAGNAAIEVVRTVNIISDTTAPVITLNGSATIELNLGDTYIELGATATDDVDGDITEDIVVDDSELNTSISGPYNVIYTVSDSSGNEANTSRTVLVLGQQDELVDCNGDVIPTIIYGTQEWTLKNSCNATYRDGTPIPEVTDNAEWENLTTGAWCYYNNDPTKPRLYNWYAVMGIHDNDPNTPNKEFAPAGWHVPSDAEWTTLEDYLIANGYNYDGTTTVNKIAKAMASTTGWNSSTTTGAVGNDQSLNNSSGFNAFPEGFRFYYGSFNDEGSNVGFWSSTGAGANSNSARSRNLDYNSSFLTLYINSERNGLSVRFVRD